MRRWIVFLSAIVLIILGIVFLVAPSSAHSSGQALHADDITVTGTTIYVKNCTGGASIVNLSDIYNDADVDDSMLHGLTSTTWLLNYTIEVGHNASLDIGSTENVTWLKMNNKTSCLINSTGGFLANNTCITGWNDTGGANISYVSAGIHRPSIFLHGNGSSTFLNTSIGYLGYNAENKTGLTVIDDLSDETAGEQPAMDIYYCNFTECYIGLNVTGLDDAGTPDRQNCTFTSFHNCTTGIRLNGAVVSGYGGNSEFFHT